MTSTADLRVVRDRAPGLAPFPSCAVGDRLPELVVPMDRTTIVAAAIASQDFEDVHHDPGKAQARGTQDIFMSINSTNGFVDRYVTDWAGPHARLQRVALRLGVPLFPGDDLTFSGEVTEVDAGGVVTLKVIGRNGRGPHVTATVVLGPVDSAVERPGTERGAR